MALLLHSLVVLWFQRGGPGVPQLSGAAVVQEEEGALVCGHADDAAAAVVVGETRAAGAEGQSARKAGGGIGRVGQPRGLTRASGLKTVRKDSAQQLLSGPVGGAE